MTSSPAVATAVPARKTCDCCKETMRAIDEDGLCFNCALVQRFATIIDEQTDLDRDAAVDLACELADCARSHILEARDNAEKKDFFTDVGVGMVRTSNCIARAARRHPGRIRPCMTAPLLPAAAASLLVLLVAGMASAQDQAKGRSLAVSLCAHCHMNEGQGEKRNPMEVPGFRAIANRPDQSMRGIVTWLRSVPPMMPNHHLSQDEMYDLAAFILSLCQQSGSRRQLRKTRIP
jgi:cytochrome c553